MKTSIAGAVLAAAATLTMSPQGAAQSTAPPNIVFVLADDLGYGELGA